MRLRRWVATRSVGPKVGPFWTRAGATRWVARQNATSDGGWRVARIVGSRPWIVG